jgi:hypothetical protein
MARAGQHLLGHLFATVKAKHDALKPGSDLEKADFLATSRMTVQARVANDPSRRKAVRCPRRAGKSWLALSIAIERCLRKARSVWVICGLARPSIQQIFWSLLKQINVTMELTIQFREVELSATLPNGSVILFRGAESRAEIEKLRGGQYDGVIIDECKSFNAVVFTELVVDVIEPALADRLGELILIGTPGDVLAGPFYEATCEPPMITEGDDGVKRASNHRYGTKESEFAFIWSLHTWTLQENTEMPHLWVEALKTKAKRGWSDQHPTWRREYLGEWVASTQKLVYTYIPQRDDYNGQLPDGHDWRYVLGLDIGFKDADAIVVLAYAETCFDVYQVYGDKRPKLNVTALAEWVREVRKSYTPEIMTADFGGLATKLFDELAIHHRLVFEPAEKREKNDYIELLNDDLEQKRVHILRANPLGKELITNRWLEKSLGTEKRVEDPKTPNDLCDAFLYAWRWCEHHRAKAPVAAPLPNSAEWWRARMADEFQAAIRQHVRNKSGSDDFAHMDEDWWHNDDR